jgi:Subtilase family
VTDASRLLRGTLPCLVAFAVATGFVLPANARELASAAPTARTASTTRGAEWWLTALQVPSAWKTASAEGKGVTVAVLSTGVDAASQDLTGAVTSGPDYSGSGRTAAGPFWGFEGTAVASLIAGHGHGTGGTEGITGVAPRARILAVQVTLEYNDPLNADRAITRRLANAIASGIRYAVSHGAGVIALPLDPATLGTAASGDPAIAGGSPAERAAVGDALAHDVVLIAPAGDNGEGTGSVNYPAAYPDVVAVGATQRGGQLAPFTSKRSYVALTAPGSGLTVAAPDGGYQTLATTDLSAALTAGVAALIRSRFPVLTAAEVVRALESGTRRAGVPKGTGSGSGALDAVGALAAAATLSAAHHTQPPSAPPTTAQALATQPATPRAAVHPAAASALAGLLRNLLIVVGALIVALVCALAFAARRRYTRSARQGPPRSGQGGSHARKPRAIPGRPQAAGQSLTGAWRQPPALPAGGSAFGTSRTDGAPYAPRTGDKGRHAASTDGAGTDGSAHAAGAGRLSHALGAGHQPRAIGPGSATPGTPRVVPVEANGALGGPGRGRRRRKSTGQPPWGPATPPKAPLLPALPAAGSQPPAKQNASLAPWERSPEEFAAAPIPADIPDWPTSNTGPMYLWNPNSTGPQPVIRPDDEPEEPPASH